MDPEAIKAIEHNIFTPGNYFYNGVGHVTVKYGEVLAIGYKGIIDKAQAELDEKMDRWVYLNDLAERIEAQKSEK